MSVPVVNELGDLYRAADAAASAALLAKLAVERSLGSRLDETRAQLQQKVAAALKEFRLLNASAASRLPSKLLFPDTLRHLPLWALGAIKCATLRGAWVDCAHWRAPAAALARMPPSMHQQDTLQPAQCASGSCLGRALAYASTLHGSWWGMC